MMPYKMQVNVTRRVDGRVSKVWRDVKPSHSPRPYTFRTKEQAYRTLGMCYPYSTKEEAKIVEIGADES